MTNAVSTNGMFSGATSFNQPLDNWNMSAVSDARSMFHNAVAFNQDLSGWNGPFVSRMENLFRNAVSFRQDISTWDFGYLTNADNMFSGTRLSGINYDKLLIALAGSTVRDDVIFHAGGSTYCEAEDARAQLISQKGWTIYDNGRDTSSCTDRDIQFTDGVAATITENNTVPIEISRFIVVPNIDGITYRFCDNQTLDSEFFTVDGTALITNTSFDFETALDSNGDNVYEFCIHASNSSGFDMQRILTVAVIDDQNEPTNDTSPAEPNSPSTQGSSDDSDAQVLSSRTDDASGGSVLAAGDEDSTKVLAASGVAILSGIATGIILVFTTTYFSRKSIIQEA